MGTFIEQQHSLRVKQGQIGLSWTGQAGFAFKDSQNVIYYIDPYFSNACSRYIGYHRSIPSPVKAGDVKADFLLFTHEHRDHLDPDSVPEIAEMNPTAKFVGPPSCISILKEMGIAAERLIPIRRGQVQKVGNINLYAVMAFHTEDSLGYVLDLEETKVYITGDTTYSDDLISTVDFKPDLMMTCINGRLGCMNIPDAARLTAHIQPEYVIPMHFGLFKENTADPEEFIRQAESYSGIVKGIILEHGSWYIFDKNKGFTNNGLASDVM